jgi:hypothetical protein
MFYVYELRDQTGAPFYVGKGSGRRMYQHESRAARGIKTHVCAKIRKLARLGLLIQKAIVLRTEDEGAAFEEEKRLIALYGRHTLTNQTDGGEGPCNPSAEVRGRIAAARRGIIASEATRKLLSLAHIGKRHTAATRARIAAKQRTIKKPWAVNSKVNLGSGFQGRQWSAQHRANFSAKRLGHVVTPATRAKISASKRGRAPWNKGKNLSK